MKAYRTLAVALMGTCLAAIGSPVAAQTAQGAPQSTATAGATDDPDAQSSDIIVTANKREERLQDVPISVAVVTGDQIVKQNVLEVTDLTRSTPSLNSAGPFGALSIRGVASDSEGPSGGRPDRRD